MKLCRFVLNESPEIVRSGIFHENHLYETDGERALGIHDLSKISLLPPVARPPSIRILGAPGREGEWRYINPCGMLGPLSSVEYAGSKPQLAVRLAVVISEPGDPIDADDAANLILAYTFMVQSCTLEPFSDDYPVVCGPFLITPDAFPTTGPLSFKVSENRNQVDELQLPLPDFPALILAATRSMPVATGDIIAGEATFLGHPFAPHSTVTLQLQDFEALTFTLS